MGSAKAFGLFHDRDLGIERPGRVTDRVSAIADDQYDLFGCKIGTGCNRMGEKRKTTQLMQDLGAFGIHPRSLARRKDDQLCAHRLLFPFP